MSQTEHRIFQSNRLTAVEYRDENDVVVVRYDLEDGTCTNYLAGDEGDHLTEVTDLSPEMREHLASTDTIEDRVARIEAILWPAPTNPGSAPVWEDVPDGQVPPMGTIRDVDDVCYRNVSGRWLRTPPSGFPPPASDHLHLWEPVG